MTKFPIGDEMMKRFRLPFFLAWFWWHWFQTSHPLTEARIIKVKKTAFQLHSLFCCQTTKLGKSCFLQQYASPKSWLSKKKKKKGVTQKLDQVWQLMKNPKLTTQYAAQLTCWNHDIRNILSLSLSPHLLVWRILMGRYESRNKIPSLRAPLLFRGKNFPNH